MKAALLPHYGSPDEFRIVNIQEQEAIDAQPIVINASMNQADILVRNVKFGSLTQLKKDQWQRFGRTGRFRR